MADIRMGPAETQFAEIIWEHEPIASGELSKIAEDNEVTVNQLKRWVREERLIFSEDSMVAIECENCGRTIRTGRFCDKCKEQLHAGLTNSIQPKAQTMIQPKKQSNAAKMRFLDRE